MVAVLVSCFVSLRRAPRSTLFPSPTLLRAVASTRVIPRPSQYLEVMVRNGDTVGYEKPAPAPEPEPPAPPEPPEAPVPPKAPAPKHSGKKSGKPLPKEAKAPAPEAVKGEAEAAAEPQGEKKD